MGRIAVTPGSLEPGGFDSVGQSLTGVANNVSNGLSEAEGAAGNAGLSAAIADLAAAMGAADRSAALSITDLGAAVAKAGSSYVANENRIAGSEHLP